MNPYSLYYFVLSWAKQEDACNGYNFFVFTRIWKETGQTIGVVALQIVKQLSLKFKLSNLNLFLQPFWLSLPVYLYLLQLKILIWSLSSDLKGSQSSTSMQNQMPEWRVNLLDRYRLMTYSLTVLPLFVHRDRKWLLESFLEACHLVSAICLWQQMFCWALFGAAGVTMSCLECFGSAGSRLKARNYANAHGFKVGCWCGGADVDVSRREQGLKWCVHVCVEVTGPHKRGVNSLHHFGSHNKLAFYNSLFAFRPTITTFWSEVCGHPWTYQQTLARDLSVALVSEREQMYGAALRSLERRLFHFVAMSVSLTTCNVQNNLPSVFPLFFFPSSTSSSDFPTIWQQEAAFFVCARPCVVLCWPILIGPGKAGNYGRLGRRVSGSILPFQRREFSEAPQFVLRFAQH